MIFGAPGWGLVGGGGDGDGDISWRQVGSMGNGKVRGWTGSVKK